MPTDPKYLREFACFRELSDAQLEAIAEITTAVCYPPGYVLFEEGKPGEHLFFLRKGNVDVLYNIGEEGQVHVDNVTGEEIVGCSALIAPHLYSATEKSLTEVEVLDIDANSLRELMENDHDLGFTLQGQIIKVLMDRILDLRFRVPLSSK